MKMVTAIVRTTSLERIVAELKRIGIRGMTISEIRGIGEQVTLDKPYSLHEQMTVFVSDAQTDEVQQVILEHAKTGMAGDGLIAVLPVESLVKIRTCRKLDEGTCKDL